MGDLARSRSAEITGAALYVHRPWSRGSLHKYRLNFKGQGGPAVVEMVSHDLGVLLLPKRPEFSRSLLLNTLQIQRHRFFDCLVN